MFSCKIRFSWKSKKIYFLISLDPKAFSNSIPGNSVLLDNPAEEVHEKIIFPSILGLLQSLKILWT